MQLLYAVLTGDLIGSSKAPRARLETTMENIAATAQFFTEFTGHDTRFTRYRGDGWQMILSPAFYLRAVTIILARLKADPQALPTRIDGMPCLMIMAEKDVVLSPAMADGMEDVISDLEKVLIKDSGHWTQQEKPEEVNRLILDWMGRRFPK